MKFLLQVFCLCFCFSCGSPTGKTDKGNPLSGTFTIHTDESHYPLVRVLTDAYMVNYPDVDIRIDTTFSVNPFELLTNTEIQTVVTGLSWNQRDSSALAQRGIRPRVFQFASDALAVIANGTYDSSSATRFSSVFNSCPGLNKTGTFKSIVTDQPGSENNRFLENHYKNTPGCLASWFTAGKQTGVLQYVSDNPQSMGFVSFCYLSEQEQSEVKKWKTTIHFVPYVAPDFSTVNPSQSTIADGSYPFARPLYLATWEPYAGPATGFGAFVASADGQRIIRLFGVAPARIPPREIYVIH